MLNSLFAPIAAFLSGFPAQIVAFVLGFAPVSEIRGAAIFAFSNNNPQLIVYGIIGNIVAAALLLLFWDFVGIEKIGRKILGYRLEAKIEEYHKHHEMGEVIALMAFIGIPLPATGVYTGVLIGKILKISDAKIIVSSFAGILIASLIMYLTLSGVFSFLTAIFG
jgi:uncharacterized membrane protein